MTEIWKDIVGYERRYQVSNLGNFRSLTREIINRGRKQIRKGRPMSVNIDFCGYYRVHINSHKSNLAHRLVALAFIHNDDIEKKIFVNHINGVKTDNRVENLEWCTKSHNAKHSFKVGLQCNKGENHPQAKLTEDIVRNIRAKYIPNKYGAWRLSKEFNLSLTHVKDIVKRKAWSHI